MTDLTFRELIDVILSTRNAYYKLTIITGQPGSGKTRLLNEISKEVKLPLVNLGLLVSERLLAETRRQRALRTEQIALEVLDAHSRAGMCVDNTEILFDAALQLNPLAFLQDLARNRLIIASWNGVLAGKELRFAFDGHPDYFSQKASGYPVVTIDDGKPKLYLTT